MLKWHNSILRGGGTVNLKSIEYFLITAEEMNFTRAAERLYISQQALSSHIKRLEDEYHVQLFARKPSLHLTLEGEQMVFYGKQILDSDKKMMAAFSDISTNCRGTLKVGMSRLRSKVFFPDIWKYYHPSHENISIELINGNSAYLDEFLQAGKLDLYLGINIPAAPNQHRIQLAQEVMHCCFSKDLLSRCYPNTWNNILAEFQRNGAVLERISDLPFGTVRQGNKLRNELELCLSRSWKPNLIFESEQQDLIYQFSKNGAFSGLLSPVTFYQFRDELKRLEGEFFIFPLRDHVQKSIFSLVYRKDYPLPRYASDFVQVACMVIRNYSKFIYSK